MAKNRSDESTQNTENTEGQVQNTEATATTAAGAGDDRFKKIKHPGTGQEVNRKDYILELWQVNKMTRGAIAKHLTELRSVENGGDGKKVPYQIVFATTKGKPGGPDKPVEGTAPAATAEQASS